MNHLNWLSYPHQKNAQKEWKIFESSGLPSLLYAANQMIYWQEEDAYRFYYLKRGSVKIFINSENGSEKTLAILQNGSLFGEAAFFDKLPRTSSAKTLEKSEIIAVSQNALIKIFSCEPNLAMDLLTYLAKTVRMLSAQVDHITFLQADRRIAQLLISLADRQNCVCYTHEEIGNLAGVTRISASRILSQFSRNGWIQTKYRSIQIVNFSELKTFAFQN